MRWLVIGTAMVATLGACVVKPPASAEGGQPAAEEDATAHDAALDATGGDGDADTSAVADALEGGDVGADSSPVADGADDDGATADSATADGATADGATADGATADSADGGDTGPTDDAVGGPDAAADADEADGAATPDTADTAAGGDVGEVPDGTKDATADVGGVGLGGGLGAPCVTHEDCVEVPSKACWQSLCEPGSKTCTLAPQPGNAPCDDENPCTNTDTCGGGICIGMAVVCNDGNACTLDDCGADGCVFQPKVIGAACVGGICLAGGICKAQGNCNSDPLICNDGDECSHDYCVGSGVCSYQALMDNSPCDDGNPCTPASYDKCFGGSCTNPKNICGCLQDADCILFDDGDLCNGGTACVATPTGKQCKPVIPPKVCPSVPGAPCLEQVCQPETGACKPKPGAPCDDENPCTVDSCKGSLGCTHDDAPSGTACSDGDACTASDSCQKGTCTAGLKTVCDDGDLCTGDECGPAGCLFPPLAGCATCLLADPDVPASLAQVVTITDDEFTSKWKPGNDSAGNGRWVLSWTGASAGGYSSSAISSILLRRLAVHAGVQTRMEFWWRGNLSGAGCKSNAFMVVANGKKHFETCESSAQTESAVPGAPQGKGWQRAVFDLSGWAGTAIDLELKVVVPKKSGVAGYVEVDRIRVAGACGPACLAADFEHRGYAYAEPSTVVAQAWRIQSTSPKFVNWIATAAGGHIGKGAMSAVWNGKPPGGKSQIATFRMPKLIPGPNSVLSFAVRAPKAGAGTCGQDRLKVTLGKTVLVELCQAQPSWKTYSFDVGEAAGTELDLEFMVQTGNTSLAAGAFQFDSVTLTGECSYACWEQGFDDAADFASWWNLPDPGMPAWTREPETPGSSNFVAALSFDGSEPAEGYSKLNPLGELRWGAPVAGATILMRTSIESAAVSCPTKVLNMHVMYQKISGMLQTFEPGLGPVEMFDAVDACPAKGWQQWQVPYHGGVLGRKHVPRFAAIGAGSGTVKIRLDDFVVRCH